MKAYVIRRLLLILPTLFILSILVFLSVRFIPGDVIDALEGRMEWLVTGGIDRAALERRLGLDVPVWVQYGRWIGDIFLHGSLGESLLGRGAVKERVMERLPVTVELGLLAIIIGLVIALPVGIYSAIRQDTAADFLGRSVAIVGLATPNFWLGAAAGIGSFHQRPAGEFGGVHRSQPDSGNGRGGRHHAHDPHHDAGSAPAGLNQDGLGEGSEGAGRSVVVINLLIDLVYGILDPRVRYE